MENKEYIDYLIERDKVKQPVQSINSFGRHGKLNLECQCCGQTLIYCGMERFCVGCGQRFSELKCDEFYEFHRVRDESEGK